ncbi:MAG: RNA polymerase factor sigma-54 [Calditrichaeota bacterium]|nr:RNA polymerase factor sigma-54 [Calditrichota bacterium]
MQGLSQQLRIRQELTLQPQQILRSELIQMPLLELELRVKSELEQNPFLDEVDPKEDSAESNEEESKPETNTDDDGNPVEVTPKEESAESDREVDWENILNDVSHWEYKPRNHQSITDNIEIPQPNIPTLAEHLYDQLRVDNLTEFEIIIGEEIIGNINRNGYLLVELDVIEKSTGATSEEVAVVHKNIMEYDPLGIAARNIRECLLVQLRHRQPPAPVTERILEEFWNDFINKRYEILAEKLEVDLEEIKTAFQIVSRLNPKPGEGYFDEKQNYVIPELIVSKVGNEYVVVLSDGDIPNFRINQAYREMYMNKRNADKSVRDFLSRKLESARWFINAIHQRRTTMIRTMRAIIARQKDFFRYGPTKLKPMILANIAEDIDMDISTISRVTNGKYVQTDWGVLELKYFFSEKMETENGDDVSNRVIKSRLKDIIGSENKLKPFSDQQLTDLLNKEGFIIKRRTVAKYREQMHIPIKRLRREI